MRPLALVISCEHAVNTIPVALVPLFQQHQHLVHSHAGIDFGALEIATYLSEQLPTAYYGRATVSRLVIDCNRSLHHRQCFSRLTQTLSHPEKAELITTYYHPFRQGVIDTINRLMQEHYRVLHLSIHSFTPIWEGQARQGDVGLLYDPKQTEERRLVQQWQHLLSLHAPEFRVRLNYPYRGTADGFTSALRKIYPSTDYMGIEVESNQALATTLDGTLAISHALTKTLRIVMS
jgi:predicted N-formylglutamate amidohydrolase